MRRYRNVKLSTDKEEHVDYVPNVSEEAAGPLSTEEIFDADPQGLSGLAEALRAIKDGENEL
jgi:DNA-directed RNA polymerase